MGRSTLTYRDVFFATYGFGPYRCAGCNEEMIFGDSFVIHHIDHDSQNHVPENLVAMHRSCHASHHSKIEWGAGFTHTEESIEKIRQASIEMWKTRKREVPSDTREKISNTLKGRFHGRRDPAKVWETRRERYGPSGRKPVC